ncbi:hypothetical protein ACIBJE_07340 [Micromonospora sp. NPDC050187]|uniref:hypothetical protein n=1 Tax=Micromonospora sp. NPDC050187 TaxID=3364277 RepID=UPI0037B6FFC8
MKKSLRRIAVAAAAATSVAVLLPGTAQAAQWNTVSQTLNGTNWTTENYVRTVTTQGITIRLELNNLPGCCLDLRLKRSSDGQVFASKFNMNTLNVEYPIATDVLADTRFIMEGRNTVSNTDRFWSGSLYY